MELRFSGWQKTQVHSSAGLLVPWRSTNDQNSIPLMEQMEQTGGRVGQCQEQGLEDFFPAPRTTQLLSSIFTYGALRASNIWNFLQQRTAVVNVIHVIRIYIERNVHVNCRPFMLGRSLRKRQQISQLMFLRSS